MSDDQGGRQIAPRPPTEVSPSPVGDLTPLEGADSREIERFSAGPQAHTIGLTEERSAQIVRQSGNARNFAILAVLFLAIFIPVYWFYDIGIPALGAQGRMAHEAEVQYVTDVARGYDLFLANCARCHGDNGQGGVGPPLNDQAKLYNALTVAGAPGTGHLNPTYINRVLEVGGRYVCGDANSVMPAWLQPAGPLNYIQVQDLVAWITAGSDVSFTYVPTEHLVGETPEPRVVHGWRDVNYKPPPDAPTPPACWRNPSGVIGGAAPAAASAAPATIEHPGTPDAPRQIELQETSSLQITDTSGTQVTQIAVQAGETVQFDVENTAGFDHNFWIGTPDQLKTPMATTDVGIPTFSSGTSTVTWTVPDSGTYQFGCTLPGHFQTMHGDFVIVPKAT